MADPGNAIAVYEYLHPLEDAVACKARLERIKDEIKSMTRGNTAVTATTNWLVNGSAREGMAMVRDFSKLMLRAYNAEADNCVRTVRPHRLRAVTDRLTKVRDTITRLGKTMHIEISAAYHHARLAEIRLTADHLGKVEEEKERIRELGDASVPFRFDTHALIFSDDAVGLEARLHQALASRKVNLVNQQREFFYASPAEVREILAQVAGQHLLEYHETPEAVEWHASQSTRRDRIAAGPPRA